jgi:hypothetical protein
MNSGVRRRAAASSSHPKYLSLTLLCVAVGAPLIVGWHVFSRSNAVTRAPTNTSSKMTPHEAQIRESANSIGVQPPATMLQESSDRLKVHGAIANCAKGFVRRGSSCELVSLTQMIMPAALSKPSEQRSVRSSERE